ncbi:MAG: viroplasmin family protein [Chitinophagaceae bacterium]
MAKQKYYVVWKGRKTGVFDNWEKCKEQIFGFPDGEYKSFNTRNFAEEAFKKHSKDFIGKDIFDSRLSPDQIKLIGNPISESISVDGAWNTLTGAAEYRGVKTKTQEELFRKGPFEEGTINIVEFLAIVHALAYCQQKKWYNIPIYSDSRNAIGWVKNKEVNTKLSKSKKNEELFDLIDRALNWLKQNKYENKILKWETAAWGENPADFGRK